MRKNGTKYPKMGKWFIYTLSDTGKIFYVGISQDIKQRYLAHLTCTDLSTGHIIYWLRAKESLPEITLINCVKNKREAKLCDTSVINTLSTIGNKLCNHDKNPVHNKLIKCIPFNRERFKRIGKNRLSEIINSSLEQFNNLITPDIYGKEYTF